MKSYRCSTKRISSLKNLVNSIYKSNLGNRSNLIVFSVGDADLLADFIVSTNSSNSAGERSVMVDLVVLGDMVVVVVDDMVVVVVVVDDMVVVVVDDMVVVGDMRVVGDKN